MKVKYIQNWKKYPPKYWLPWQQGTQGSIETNLERLPIKF